mmetsp:Transcript_5830/g.24332  ORF Transcript_5830/g.24332 Transcript_5830/m.24332 type:complete len:374 (-) Transcript_5830:824-1945(-)
MPRLGGTVPPASGRGRASSSVSSDGGVDVEGVRRRRLGVVKPRRRRRLGVVLVVVLVVGEPPDGGIGRWRRGALVVVVVARGCCCLAGREHRGHVVVVVVAAAPGILVGAVLLVFFEDDVEDVVVVAEVRAAARLERGRERRERRAVVGLRIHPRVVGRRRRRARDRGQTVGARRRFEAARVGAAALGRHHQGPLAAAAPAQHLGPKPTAKVPGRRRLAGRSRSAARRGGGVRAVGLLRGFGFGAAAAVFVDVFDAEEEDERDERDDGDQHKPPQVARVEAAAQHLGVDDVPAVVVAGFARRVGRRDRRVPVDARERHDHVLRRRRAVEAAARPRAAALVARRVAPRGLEVRRVPLLAVRPALRAPRRARVAR